MDNKQLTTSNKQTTEIITLEEGRDFNCTREAPGSANQWPQVAGYLLLGYLVHFIGYLPRQELLMFGLGAGFICLMVQVGLEKAGVGIDRNYPGELCIYWAVLGGLHYAGILFYAPLVIIAVCFILNRRKHI